MVQKPNGERNIRRLNTIERACITLTIDFRWRSMPAVWRRSFLLKHKDLIDKCYHEKNWWCFNTLLLQGHNHDEEWMMRNIGCYILGWGEIVLNHIGHYSARTGLYEE